MNRCDGKLLESFLSAYGWSYRREGDGAWRTGFRGEDQSFPLSILLSESWVTFSVQPFLSIPVDWESWPEISRMLLELNSKSTMVKLSLNPSGQMELSLEAFAINFEYDVFCLAMGLLGFYADSFYDEILTRLDSIGFRYTESLNLLT
jgi:hypothetical protein